MLEEFDKKWNDELLYCLRVSCSSELGRKFKELKNWWRRGDVDGVMLVSGYWWCGVEVEMIGDVWSWIDGW